MMPESGRTVLPCGRPEETLDFGLLGDLQRVIYFDSEIPDGTFQPMSFST
jgi:hypothetical protein